MTQEKATSAQRRLVAIMFADIVGYTAMMQKDEQKTKALRDRHRKTLVKSIQARRGELIQYYGDGSLSIFRSSVDAVKCAIDIQSASKNDLQVPLRVGIHTGDVIVDQEGVFGDGVNLASRIESLAVTGSVMISEKVFDDVKNHSEILMQSMGEFELKNVAKPIEVFAVVNEGLRKPAREELAGKVKEKIKSIAVMPLINMSSDSENEYFSDGITDELINALAKVDGLRVTSRTSSFAFKGKALNLKEVSEQLNVNSVLEGSVRRAGNKVRISVQLVSAADGYQVWAESYDRLLEDIFAIQDEISTKIANQLREKLSLKEHGKVLVSHQTENFEAYNNYLMGLFHYNKWSHANVEKAIKYFEEAILQDPDFLLPYAGLASCYVHMGTIGFIKPDSAFGTAEKYANKVLSKDQNNEEAQLALAQSDYFFRWDWESAKKRVDKVLKINPNSPTGRILKGLYFLIKGDFKKAYAEQEIAYKSNPLSVNVLRTLADNRYFTGDYAKAIQYYDKALEVDPQYIASKEFKGWTYMMMGDLDQAIAIFKSLEKETIFAVKPHTQLGYAHALKGEKAIAEDYLRQLEDSAKSKSWASYSMDFAILHTGLGNFDDAFHYLEQCVKERMGNLVLLHISPIWGPLYHDPRFQDLIKRLNLGSS